MVAKKKEQTPVETEATNGRSDLLCQCGCGEQLLPGGRRSKRFKQGHDSRFHGRVKKLKAGTMTWKELSGMIGAYALEFYKAEVPATPRKRAKAGVAAEV